MKAKLQVPGTLNDITLGQYQRFKKIAENITEGEFLNQKMVEIFCNVQLHHVLLIKRSSVLEIVNHINSLFNNSYELSTVFDIQGHKFGFIPNLDKITQGEYVDLDTYIVDWDKMHNAMAVLYRPIKEQKGDKYTIIDYQGTDEFANLMKHMPLGVALGAYVFFYHLGSELLNSTLKFLQHEAKELISQHSDNFQNVGDGIMQYIDLLTDKYLDLTKSPANPFTSALHFSPMRFKRIG